MTMDDKAIFRIAKSFKKAQELDVPTEPGWYWAKPKDESKSGILPSGAERVVYVDSSGLGDDLVVWEIDAKGVPLDEYFWLSGPLQQ